MFTNEDIEKKKGKPKHKNFYPFCKHKTTSKKLQEKHKNTVFE